MRIINVTKEELDPHQRYCPIKTAMLKSGYFRSTCVNVAYWVISGYLVNDSYIRKEPTSEMVKFMKQWDRTHSNVEPFSFDFDSLPDAEDFN